jgi:hypothetical protein
VALTTMADGQLAIVPDDALAHARTCDACARAMGEAAMLSARVAAVLATAETTAVSKTRAPIPWVAIAAALTVAALGALPALADYPLWMTEAASFVTRTVPLLLRSALAVVRSGGGSVGPVVSFACSTLLLVMGFAIARAMPRRMESV